MSDQIVLEPDDDLVDSGPTYQFTDSTWSIWVPEVELEHVCGSSSVDSRGDPT